MKPTKFMEVIRSSSVSEVALVSLLILPAILSAWAGMLSLYIPDSLKTDGEWVLGVTIFVYCVALVFAKYGHHMTKRSKRQADMIVSYLNARSWTRISAFRLEKDVLSGFVGTEKTVEDIVSKSDGRLTITKKLTVNKKKDQLGFRLTEEETEES